MNKELIYQTLKKYWGYDSFRGRQEEAVQETLDNKHIFFLAPTSLRKIYSFSITSSSF